MPRGIRREARLGRLTGDFDPINLHPDLLRLAKGEDAIRLETAYPIMEIMRFAKLALDQRRSRIRGVENWDDRFALAMRNAMVEEVTFHRETSLLTRLHANGHLPKDIWREEVAILEEAHDRTLREVAYAAAGWLAAIEKATTPRPRGRPPRSEEKSLPDHQARIDWLVCGEAHAMMHREPMPQGALPWERLPQFIPAAAAKAIKDGLLTQQLGDTPGRNLEAHVDRIRRRLRNWFSGPP